jgi:hypothetical protein
MSDWLLDSSALLLIVTGMVHSLLGENRLITPLLSRRDGILASNFARFLLRFAWHLTSVSWAVVALILVQSVHHAATVRWWAAGSTGAAFTVVALVDLVGSRGRHVGWPLLSLIGLAALLSLIA